MDHHISNIQIIPVKGNNGLVGFASIIYNHSIYLGNIGIMTRLHGGFRLTYPTRSKGKAPNVFHPISRVAADHIENAIILKFQELTRLQNGAESYTD